MLYLPIPGANKTFRHNAGNGGQAIEISFNKDGFRGPDLDRKEDGLRLMVYGDSFIEGEFSDLEATYAYQLGSLLNDRCSRPVESVNAGTNGYGPDQILQRIESDLPQFKPDLVIVSIFADNDFGDLVRNKMYRLNENGALVENQFVFSQAITNQFSARDRFAFLKFSRQLYWSIRNGQPQLPPMWLQASPPNIPPPPDMDETFSRVGVGLNRISRISSFAGTIRSPA